MTNFLRSTTQASNLQQAIEKVTDPSQTNEDWALIMQICDYVATKDERFVDKEKTDNNEFVRFLSAKETMKVIRKRLQVNPTTHGWNTIVLTLTVRRKNIEIFV